LPPLDRLVAAIEQNGCELSGSTASAVMLRANLTPDQIEALGPDMANDGRFELNDAGAIRVLTDRCI